MPDCVTGLKRELAPSNLGLEHPKPELFVTSQWELVQPGFRRFYMIWRMFFGLFWITILIVSGLLQFASIDRDGPFYNTSKFFIYLTNYALILLALDSIVQAIHVIIAAVKYSKIRDMSMVFRDMPWFLKLQWVLSNVTLCLGLLVTFAFFTFVNLEQITSPEESSPRDVNKDPYVFLHICTHLFNSIYLVTNFLISGTPLRLYHVYHSLLLVSAYLIFTGIYYLLGGTDFWGNTDIYPMFNWDKPLVAGLNCFLLGFVGVIIVWLILYGFYRARTACFAVHHKRRKKYVNPVTNDYPYFSSSPYVNNVVTYYESNVPYNTSNYIYGGPGVNFYSPQPVSQYVAQTPAYLTYMG